MDFKDERMSSNLSMPASAYSQMRQMCLPQNIIVWLDVWLLTSITILEVFSTHELNMIVRLVQYKLIQLRRDLRNILGRNPPVENHRYKNDI